MGRTPHKPRIELAREVIVLQLKLVVDGLRDALLIPVSLVAAAIGAMRGGDDCDREFRRVLKWGRRSERWIDLFGDHRPPGDAKLGKSMESILDEVERTVLEQVRKPPADAAASAAPPEEADTEPAQRDRAN